VAAAPTPAPPTPPRVLASLSVSSSIADGSMLSGTVHWTATASASAGQVDAVVFAIDGNVAATVHAPFAYDLDTHALSDGSHTFSVTALGSDGSHLYMASSAWVGNGGGQDSQGSQQGSDNDPHDSADPPTSQHGHSSHDVAPTTGTSARDGSASSDGSAGDDGQDDSDHSS
jgi:hypothetical protein